MSRLPKVIWIPVLAAALTVGLVGIAQAAFVTTSLQILGYRGIWSDGKVVYQFAPAVGVVAAVVLLYGLGITGVIFGKWRWARIFLIVWNGFVALGYTWILLLAAVEKSIARPPVDGWRILIVLGVIALNASSFAVLIGSRDVKRFLSGTTEGMGGDFPPPPPDFSS